MGYRLLFLDDFNNATVDVLTSSGNGSITEPAGSSLVLSGSLGINCDWWTSPTQYTPVGYQVLASYINNDWGLVFFETRLTAYTRSSAHVFSGLTLWRDRNNFYKAGFRWYDQRAYLSEIVGGNSVPIDVSGNTMGDPNTTPHRYRFYCNFSPVRLTIDLDSQTIVPGQVAFYYSQDDGATWTLLNLSTPGFTPLLFGILAGNGWGSTPSFSTSWDYLALWQDDAAWLQHAESSSTEDNLAMPQQGNIALEQIAGGSIDSTDTGFGEATEDAWQIGQSAGVSTQTGTLRSSIIADSQGEGLEDSAAVRLGLTPTYCPSANDLEGHPYFINMRLRNACLYDATNDPWNDPVTYSLSGYARDGYQYISGVKQVAKAPWATESASADRSSRSDFPVRSLLVISQTELVIFDLDAWPTSMKVWMRFRIGDASNFYLLGRVSDSLRAVKMLNGTLMVGSVHNGIENGGLFCIDFKRTSTNFALLVRSDGWWNGTAGRNITNRNQTGNWTGQGTGFALDSEYVHYLDATIDSGVASREKMWVVAGSEDLIRIVEISTNQPQFDYDPIGTLSGPYDNLVSGLKCSLFDSAGWLWLGNGSYIFRNIADFQKGVIVMGCNDGSQQWRHKYVQLVHPYKAVVVKSLTQINESIYAATNVGVYRINRFTLAAYLCYTVSGGLGGGKDNLPPAGELLGGEAEYTEWVKGFVANCYGYSVGYLAIASSQATFSSSLPTHGRGAVTVIRTFDDAIIDRRTYTGLSSGLTEDGAWFLMPFVT